MSQGIQVLRGVAVMLCLALAVAAPARAGLGDAAASVARDHQALHGESLSIADHGAYSVHEIAMASGTHVREYVAPAGQVFAVGWSGIELPDLRQVLSTHYAGYAAQTGRRRSSHKLLVISTPDLKLQMVKLPRGFAGVAQVPALVPTGVDVSAIR